MTDIATAIKTVRDTLRYMKGREPDNCAIYDTINEAIKALDAIAAHVESGGWLPLSELPLDGKRVDVLAKKWRAETDDFEYTRFTDVWNNHLDGKVVQWHAVPKDWCPVAFMKIPEVPNEA